MVSTQRVKLTTSKATVLERVPVLAKSRSEEEAKTRVSQSLDHFLGDEITLAFLMKSLFSKKVIILFRVSIAFYL